MKEFFGRVSSTRYRIITSRFYELRAAKKYVNTAEVVREPFTFTCKDFFSGCDRLKAAYVKIPERSVVTLCPLFFSSRFSPLSKMCSSRSFVPSNDAHVYRGTNLSMLCRLSGYTFRIRSYYGSRAHAPRRSHEITAIDWYASRQLIIS